MLGRKKVKIERIKDSFIFCLVLLLFLSLNSMQAKTQEQEQKVDTLQQIIQMVVENNPILGSQRSYIYTLQQMPEPGAGFVNLDKLQSQRYRMGEEGTEVPLLSLSQAIQIETIREKKIEREKTIAQANQTYENLKQTVLFNLMTKITEMTKLKNKKKNLEELKSFLQTRQDSLEKQVKAGVKEPTTLYDLMERVMQTTLDLENATEELRILKLETAVGLGGEKWEDLLNLLDKV